MNFSPDKFEDMPGGRDMVPVASLAEPHHGTTLAPMILQYWHIVVRRRWVIIGIIVSCFVAGLISTLLMAPKYTARAQLEISREQKQITSVQGIESDEAGRDIEFYATQYALLKTRSVAERVAKELKLASNNEFFAAHGIDIAAAEDSSTPQNVKLAEREKLAVNLLLKNVDISPVRTSRLVDINYTSQSPDFSARIANAWTKAFIAGSMDRQFASTADARRFLEQRLEVLRARLEQSERQAVTYAAGQGIVTLDQVRDAEGRTQSNRTLASTDLDALNTALNEAIGLRIAAESRLGGAGQVTAEALGSSSVAGLRQQRAQVAAEYARLSVQYEAGYPTVQALAQQLKSLDAAIAQESGRFSNIRTQEYKQAVARENDLRNRVAQLRKALSAQQNAGIQWNIYQREADTNRQLYDALLQRYKEIGVAGTVGANNISIVEPAQIPTGPSSPNLPLNLALSLMAGVALAGVAAFALEQLDEGIRDPSQVQGLLGLPLLGNTPAVDDSLEIEMSDTKSHLYEAYFSIRSNLAFATDHGFPRSVAVTSTRPAEGKSSTAFALAVILGRTGKKVLLVDADMRSPSLHVMTDRLNKEGFSNYLAGEDNWQRLVQETEYKGVGMVSAGPMPPSAAELLTGDRLHRFIAQVLEQYDHIVIDSPPILGLTDAPILSRAVEGCVLIVQAEGVPIRGIRASIARLHMVQANIFGVIVTKLQQRQGGYGYGYGYGYGGDLYGTNKKS